MYVVLYTYVGVFNEIIIIIINKSIYNSAYVDFQIMELRLLCTLFNALSCGVSHVSND